MQVVVVSLTGTYFMLDVYMAVSVMESTHSFRFCVLDMEHPVRTVPAHTGGVTLS